MMLVRDQEFGTGLSPSTDECCLLGYVDERSFSRHRANHLFWSWIIRLVFKPVSSIFSGLLAYAKRLDELSKN
jgi:hypothetical protein